MNAQEINEIIDSEFEDYLDDSDDDPTWISPHDVNLSNESDSESEETKVNRCLFQETSHLNAEPRSMDVDAYDSEVSHISDSEDEITDIHNPPVRLYDPPKR